MQMHAPMALAAAIAMMATWERPLLSFPVVGGGVVLATVPLEERQRYDSTHAHVLLFIVHSHEATTSQRIHLASKLGGEHT